VATKPAVLEAIRRMGALQIDSINVVARSPYLVLWSRLGPYEPRWLDEALSEGALFEYWSHAACFLPIEDYSLYRRAMLDGSARSRTWIAEHPEEVGRVRARLYEQGEVRAAEFARTGGRSNGWWDWKPEKVALECLFVVGEVMIARRDTNFQRVYVPRERILPQWDDAAVPGAAEVDRRLALTAVRALGVATAAWTATYFNGSRKRVATALKELAAEGALEQVTVAGLRETAYLHPAHGELAAAAADGALQPRGTAILSPFDPLTWDRARALALFGFHYRIEAYTRAEQRRYGYFVLPILHDGALVGRLDAKAHRAEGRFEVRELHLEPGVAVDDHLVAGLADALASCAAWHKTPEVQVRRSDPPALAGAVASALVQGVQPA
jgi:uncharacterized protein YcaQ